MTSHIRNFVITAHIDHGKSTLADRLLELTGTVEKRKMRAQYLDQLELERERGITIKMAPVRMHYRPQFRISNSEFRNSEEVSKSKNSEFIQNSKFKINNSNLEYILNLIDTPGHSDFSYEVSRALAAVEGAILLVDVTKGIQAQTLSNFRNAKKAGLTIIGAVNKIDVPGFDADQVAREVAELLECAPSEIFRISGKTGEGVTELLRAVIERVPPPRVSGKNDVPRALIFDSLYDDHKGIIAYVRAVDGTFLSGEPMRLAATEAEFKAKELGFFVPQYVQAKKLEEGEIGYIATGLKDPNAVRIGDTLFTTNDARNTIHGARNTTRKPEPLHGYREPQPVVFISFYPDGTTNFEDLKKALDRLHLTDAALHIEPDANEALGRGLKVGFLGQLHLEIIAARMEREFGTEFLTSFPSIAYRVKTGNEERIIKEPHAFPVRPDEVWEPIIDLEIVVPNQYLQSVLSIQRTFSFEVRAMETIGNALLLECRMPLAELIRDFDDQLKSVSEGYASFSYEPGGEEKADVVKLEILVADDVIPALTRIVARKDLEREARTTAERLKELLPRQQFAQAVQASAEGRIIARETIPAMRKDVTGYLYGGDRSRKMKLWKKQQRGKEKLKELASARGRSSSGGKVNVPVEVFREILKK